MTVNNLQFKNRIKIYSNAGPLSYSNSNNPQITNFLFKCFPQNNGYLGSIYFRKFV